MLYYLSEEKKAIREKAEGDSWQKMKIFRWGRETVGIDRENQGGGRCGGGMDGRRKVCEA